MSSSVSMGSTGQTRSWPTWLELGSATGLVLSYIWLWQGSFEGDALVCLALFLTITVSSHRRNGETPRELGFRLDNLVSSARLILSWVVPVIAVIVVSGLAMGLQRQPPIERFWARAALMPLFGIAQEYGLLGFYYRRLQEVLPGDWLPVLASALVFTLLHVPNVPLMVMTFLASLGACWLYRRAPNLWVLGMAHGLLSIAVAMFLAGVLVTGLKVGPRALR